MNPSRKRLLLVLSLVVLFAGIHWLGRGLTRHAGVDPQPNLVLIVVDTLRADHLGCYGALRPTSPNIDALAGRSLLFEQAYAPSSWTLPSMASLWTGKLPSEHGVQSWTGAIPPDVPVLPEILKAQGYVTVGIVGNANLSADLGFGRGFDLYVEGRTEPKLARTGLPLYPSAGDMTDMAIDALDRLRDKRFFLYVHYMDPHSPYLLPDDAKEAFPDPDYDGFLVSTLAQVRPLVGSRFVRVFPYFWSKFRDVEADRARIRQLYDSKIRYTDRHIGRLLEHLDSLKLSGNTIVAFTADHGEGLFQNGIRMHEAEPYQHQVHIPLMLSGPHLPPASRIETPVELLDLPLALSRLTSDGQHEWPVEPSSGNGRLLDVIHDRTVDGDKSVVAQVYIAEKDLDVWMVEENKAKLMVSRVGRQLFDLTKDPGEMQNVIGKRPELETRLNRIMLRRLGALEPPLRQAAHHDAVTDPALLERLRALGYVQ